MFCFCWLVYTRRVVSVSVAYLFYAYATPLIVIIGITGNAASFAIFRSRQLRRFNSTLYLTALSVSDTLVLLTYVLLGWLNDGLAHWPGNHSVGVIHTEGVCQLFLFVSYLFRFTSVYLILALTIERYIVVWMPLKRNIICTRGFAFKLIGGALLAGCVASLYRPIFNGMYVPADVFSISDVTDERKLCIGNVEYDDIIFIFETIYGFLIMGIPFVLMLIFNALIVYKLLNPQSSNLQPQLKTRETKIRWEFTIILLSISTCFIATNLPYFVVWLLVFRTAQQANDSHNIEHLMAQKRITQTIFYTNYCINFFIYCLTGRNYRSVIKDWCRCGRTPAGENAKNGYTAVRLASVTNHTQHDYV